jgi:DNA-binding response OmpR family regulator
MLPGMNGFEIVKMARGEGISTPVIMLTAKSDITDKVTGLDCGADDYLTKPFQIEELLARLRALIRRNIKDTDGILSAYDLNLNTKSLNLICTTTNKEIRLPEKEFKIMECLISNNGQILSKEQLAMKVWGYNNEAEYNNVEVYISFTRKKLKFLGTKTEIKSIRGIGYELRG